MDLEVYIPIFVNFGSGLKHIRRNANICISEMFDQYFLYFGMLIANVANVIDCNSFFQRKSLIPYFKDNVGCELFLFIVRKKIVRFSKF